MKDLRDCGSVVTQFMSPLSRPRSICLHCMNPIGTTGSDPHMYVKHTYMPLFTLSQTSGLLKRNVKPCLLAMTYQKRLLPPGGRE